jgi:hypothetical protein
MVKRDNKGRFIYTTGGGKYRRKEVDGKNIQYSRYVWELKYGKIPNGLIVHHLDGNKYNNDINNLSLVSYSVHNKIHKHQPWNKELSTKTNKKWAETIKKAQASRFKTFIKLFAETYRLRLQGKKLREIAGIQNISSRQVSDRIRRYSEYKDRKMFKINKNEKINKE